MGYYVGHAQEIGGSWTTGKNKLMANRKRKEAYAVAPSMIKRGMVHCYYCGAVLTDANLELDHFPIPEKAGGKHVVPCCICCHDMKDRVEFDLWGKDWLVKVRGEFNGLSREMKIFLAQAMRRIYAWRQNGIDVKGGDACDRG